MWSLLSEASEKKVRLTPFQASIEKCFGNKIDYFKINSTQKLYAAIKEKFSLQTSEIVFREVKYRQKGLLKKLKYDAGYIYIYKIDDEDNLELVSTEKFEVKSDFIGMRHKILTPEGRINQLLFQASVESDFQRSKETRLGQLELEITSNLNSIKSLEVILLADKKIISCDKKSNTDICSCRI